MEIWPFPAFPGDPILRQESQLCLTATSVVFLTECFESVSGKEETGIGCLLNQLFFLTDTNILKFLMSDNITTHNFKNISGTFCTGRTWLSFIGSVYLV